MADATFVRFWDDTIILTAAAVSVGELFQLPDGRAAYCVETEAKSSGVQVKFRSSGQVTVTKTTAIQFLDGGRVFWDHSANAAHFKAVNDRDFYAGVCVGDFGTADANCVVNLNVKQVPRIDLLHGEGALSVLAGTPAAGAFGYPVMLGGAALFELTATNEAQKVDLFSVDRVSVDANGIAEFVLRVISDGGAGAQDISIGVANGTHATDFQTVAEFVALHLDGGATAINAQSDDGTTDVAPTDTTKVYVEGSEVANRFECWIDMRNKADVQIYIDGVNVLTATVFTLAAAAGPLGLIVHAEKTATTDTYKLAVDRAILRTFEQALNGT